MSVPTRSVGEPAARAGDPLVGTVLAGRYLIGELLGAGGMGRIYLAEQTPLGRKVAVKVRAMPASGRREGLQSEKRFFLEASILSKLQHPNIVTVFDYGRLEGEEDAWFMVMEYLAGETLHRRVRDAGVLTAGEFLPIARQIARGLREAHRHGVVHRDLKPSNVMLVADDDGGEVVKIVDFGLVKVLGDGAEELTREGVFLGSPRYMSPEQIAHGRVDHRTDLYSLGVMLYECLCGRAPFEAYNSIQTLIAHMQNPPPPMRERSPEVAVHPALEALVLRCLEKAPQRRPATMDDFLDELHACEESMGLAPSSSTPNLSGPQPQLGYRTSAATSERPPPPQELPPLRTGRLRTLTVPSAPRVSLPAPPAEIVAPRVSVRPPPPPEASGEVAAEAPPGPAAPAPPPPSSRPAPSARGSRGAIYGLSALTAVLSGVAVWQATRPPPAPVVITRAAPLMPTTYELTVESETDGAQVYEGSALLGAAPLTLTVDNPVVATRPRQLQVRREGFLPVVVSVGPSTLARSRVAVRLTAEPPRPAPAPREPASYTLLVSSPVAFAQVYEGITRLGTTPLRLEIDNAAVRARPRRLEVRRIGFEPYAFDVGPASAPTLVEARLQERPPRIVLPRAAPRPTTARPAAPTRPPARANAPSAARR